MFPIFGAQTQLCDSLSRRELLRVGGASAFGLSLPDLLRARETAVDGILPTDKTFGRAKNLIYLYLQGGPPQHETFDPKPEAPAEIRGPFNPIHTNVPGMDFCELLPRTARIADKLAVVRSMSTDDNVHSSSGYWVLTGYKYVGPNARTIQPTDHPNFGSLVKMLKPSDVMPPLSSVWIPDMIRLNESVTPAGQTGGFLGSQWTPDRFVGDPNSPEYKVRGLSLGDLPPMRVRERASLLQQVESHFRTVERGSFVRAYDKFQQEAFDLMTSDRARKAFAIEEESEEVRNQYTRTTWGQCCLLSRRLIEAGVRMVHVNWPREAGDNAVDNPLWDTHAQNHDRVEDVLCPQFDVTFTTLIEDLEQRGLLDDTLVVAIGEFGRTPKINAKAGRDHWGHVFSFAMAGAGVNGGQVYGSSDANGGYPADDRVRPGDLTATIFHLLGINWQNTFHDREGREHRLTEGQPLYRLLGTERVKMKLRTAGGEIARVPVFDPERLLNNSDFSETNKLQPAVGSSRPKQWRASPYLQQDEQGFGVRYGDADHVLIGADTGNATATGTTAFLAQEVRSPFAGTYRLKVDVRTAAASKSAFEQHFNDRCKCRIEFFQFTEAAKSPLNRKQLAAADFRPEFSDAAGTATQTIQLTKTFENPNPGGNFSFGLGLGIAVVVEHQPNPERSALPNPVHLVVENVNLEFIGKERNEKVKV